MDIKKKYLTIIFILVLIICVVIINTPKNNIEKHTTENFNDIEGISIDNLDNIEDIYFDNKKNNYHLTDITNLDDYLDEKIKTEFNIQELIDDYVPEEIQLIEYLPKGTILMWNNKILPSDKWKWCDGENKTPDLRYFMPLGGKYKLPGDNKNKENDGIIKQEHLFNLFDEEQITADGEQNPPKIKKEFIPAHTHMFTNFPDLNHSHGQTDSQGSHSHNYKRMEILTKRDGKNLNEKWHACAGWDTGSFPKDIGSTTSYAGKHTHTTNKRLDGVTNTIKNTYTTEENIYTSTTDVADNNSKTKKFYPKCTLINFIIKKE